MQSLCFPKACCGFANWPTCDMDSGVGSWVFDEIEALMDRECAQGNTHFCFVVRSRIPYLTYDVARSAMLTLRLFVWFGLCSTTTATWKC